LNFDFNFLCFFVCFSISKTSPFEQRFENTKMSSPPVAMQQQKVSPREHYTSRPVLKRSSRAEFIPNANGVLSRNRSLETATAATSSGDDRSDDLSTNRTRSSSHIGDSPADIVDAVIASIASTSPRDGLLMPPTVHFQQQQQQQNQQNQQHVDVHVSRNSPNRPRKLTRTTTYRDYCAQIFHSCPGNKCIDACFFGEFIAERRTRNYDYHSNFSASRQQFQDSLVRSVLESGVSSDKPRLVFTAGPMGAGKGFALKLIAPQVGIVLDDFLKIDPDHIKELLPEYQMLKKKDPTIAGSQVHQESGFIQEIVLERALKLSKNIILDGSMRDWQWYLKEIERIQAMYPAYAGRLDIVCVQASEAVVMKRARERGAVTGRVIPPALLRDCIRQVPLSVDILRHAVRKTFFVNNDHTPFIESTFTSDQSSSEHALQAIVSRTKTQAELFAHTVLRDTAMQAGASPGITEPRDSVHELAIAMQRGIQYDVLGGVPFAFTGSSAVSWMVTSGHASTRFAAVPLGQQLLEQGVLRHIKTSAPFGDNGELFRLLVDDSESKAQFNIAAQGVLYIHMAALDDDFESSGVATLVLKMLDAEFERDPMVQIQIKRFANVALFSDFARQKRTELATRFGPARFHNSAPLVWFTADDPAIEHYVGGCAQLLMAIIAFPKFLNSRAMWNLRDAYFLADLLPTPAAILVARELGTRGPV
jgi:hypothetical protein